MHRMWEYGNKAIHNLREVTSLQMHGISVFFYFVPGREKSKKPKQDGLINSPPQNEYCTSDWATIATL